MEEAESGALEHHLEEGQLLATSRIAIVEVLRATELANPSADVRDEADRLLASCAFVDVSDGLLRAAAQLGPPTLRTLDAIHLASAMRLGPDEFIVYDRRLASAAAEQGLPVSQPGASP